MKRSFFQVSRQSRFSFYFFSLLLLLASGITFSSTTARADTNQVLFTAKNEIIPDFIIDIYVKLTEQGRISGLGYVNQGTRKKIEWTLSQMTQGVDVINPLKMKLGRFQAINLDPASGGCINLKTRDKIFFPTYPDFFINLVKINEHWEAREFQTGKPFNRVMLRLDGNDIAAPELSWEK